jgi:hypothetical protein
MAGPVLLAVGGRSTTIYPVSASGLAATAPQFRTSLNGHQLKAVDLIVEGWPAGPARSVEQAPFTPQAVYTELPGQPHRHPIGPLTAGNMGVAIVLCRSFSQRRISLVLYLQPALFFLSFRRKQSQR